MLEISHETIYQHVLKNRRAGDTLWSHLRGYWFNVAESLEEAAKLAARNPCLEYGIFYEIRPLDPELASVFNVTVETLR